MSLHQHFVLVDAAIWPFVLDGGLQRIPVHLELLLLVFWVWGLVLKTFLLAVERSLFYIDLFQVFDVLLDAKSSFAHIVAIDIVKWNFLIIFRKLKSVLCGIESVLHSLEPFLALVDLILTWSWKCSLFFLQSLLFKPLRLREIA